MAYLVKSPSESPGRRSGPFVAHIPGVWSRDWKPIVEAFDFLIAKGSGRWKAGREKSDYAPIKPLSKNTVLALGYDLTNFFDWIETRSLCWKTAGSDFLLALYADDQAGGHWSKRSDEKLSAATIKRRVGTVSEFLEFSGAVAQGPRDFQSLAPSRKIVRIVSEKPATPVRQSPDRLRLPTRAELKQFVADLESLHGQVGPLIAQTIFGVGLRSDEALSLHCSQLPAVAEGAKTSRMEICYGTKGGRFPGDPHRKGKSRGVQVPTALLKKLHTYARIDRKLALKKFAELNPGAPSPKELFLSSHNGRPFSYSRFYEIWRSPTLPFDHFSPHLGRHSWACYTLLEKIREEILLSGGKEAVAAEVLSRIGETLIDVWIKPQLGHVDRKTTNLYLIWVADVLAARDLTETWFDFLDG